ncbi:MAG: dipeptidase [Propionibacteriaceae bacterium]|jgi:acetylornithine deacetylase/succinyl-diaminopimelate desuccinylase-like protein|nr:dipeptidase [Propionibacteriaceae bacterium]
MASVASVPDPLASRLHSLLVTALAEQLVADLTRLVAIPSIGALPQHAPDLARSAALVADLFRGVGVPEVEVVDDVAAPAVLGHWPGPEGAPTVCLYAHHDVQPIGDPAGWRSDPFTLTARGDRLFGRGAADDKGGIALHLATLRHFAQTGGRPPVGIKLFIEGEEEMGSPGMAQFLERYRDRLAADAFVIADSGNWAVGEPAFTVALRGVTGCTVEVRTLDHGVHSGQFGGVLPDAVTALIHLLATLHQADGSVAVEGLTTDLHFGPDYPDDRFRAESGILDGVGYLGQGAITDRLWAGPAITVIGMDVTAVADASNTLAPVARASISLRVPPTIASEAAQAKLIAHLESHVPWGAQLTVTPHTSGNPALVDVDGPVAQKATQAYTEVFGRPPVLMGQGGSIPLINELLELYPGSAVIANAVCDPDSRMHAPDESVHLGDLEQQVGAQVRFLELLGA